MLMTWPSEEAVFAVPSPAAWMLPLPPHPASSAAMEATAIAHVCHNFNVPFVVVRAISDVADQQSHLSFDEFLAVAAKQSSLMVESLVQKLAHG